MQEEIFKEEWLDREPRLGNMWANINYQVDITDHTYILIVYLVVYIMLKLQTNLEN